VSPVALGLSAESEDHRGLIPAITALAAAKAQAECLSGSRSAISAPSGESAID